VNVVPDLSGLRFNFLLETSFPLAGSSSRSFESVSYTRFFQAVNLPDEDLFDKERLPLSEKVLLDLP
jgi:hypothetical protein